MSSDLKPQNAEGYECFVKKNKTIRFWPGREAVFWRGEEELDKKELIGEFYFRILKF
jgi:hypothetical protein